MQNTSRVTDKRLVLEETRRALDKIFDAGDAIDAKIQALLGFTSLIVSLAGVLQLSLLKQSGSPLFAVVLIVVLALYAAVFYVGFLAMRPRTREAPISRDWEEINQLYFNESEEKVLLQLISDHLEVSDAGEAINTEKARAVRRMMILLFTLVCILLVAIPLSFAAL